MSDKGMATIRASDLIKWRSMPGLKYDFGLMCELKKHGAPILGNFAPYPDSIKYKWRTEVRIDGTLDYYWELNK